MIKCNVRQYEIYGTPDLICVETVQLLRAVRDRLIAEKGPIEGRIMYAAMLEIAEKNPKEG